MSQARGALAIGPVARMIGFIGHLRTNGFALGPADTEAALRLMTEERCLSRADARKRLRILLACRREQWDRFDDLFEAYWSCHGRIRTRARPKAGTASGRQHDIWQRHLGGEPNATPSRKPGVQQVASSNDDIASTPGKGRLIATHENVLRQTDLRHIIDPDEIKAAEQLAYRLACAIRYRLSRRYRVARKGQRPDLRRTLRASLSTGGDPLDLVERARPHRPVRLIVLLDVSGSMQSYSRFFLQFVKGLLCTWLEAEAFLFHARLVRITEAIRDKDAIRAMGRVALMAEGFGGGTRLGACLKIFNDRYAKRVLNSKSVVLCLSDGYDTGSCDDLVEQLSRLKKRVPRLVWLNPLLGWQDYEPVNKAMVAALPLIDHFAAAHSLEALAAIETDLARL